MAYPVMPLGFLGSQGDQDSYRIERSLRFNSADSAYLSRTPASAGNRKTWTWSGWVKRGKLGVQDFIIFNEGGVSSNYLIARFASGGSGDIIEFFGSAGAFNKTTNQVFRDTSAWYHLVFVMDATNTQARIYVNGVEASYSTNTNPSNTDQNFNRAQETNIGRSISGTQHFDGYLTEINFIDGQALTPSSFGETDAITGRWKAKAFSGTYGTNGFYLSFKDNTSTTTLGYDDAGSNDWTLNNFSVTAGADNDSLVDSPTNYGTDTGVGGEVRGNYCVYIANDAKGEIASAIENYPSNGGLFTACNTNGYYASYGTNFGFRSGKWYFEYVPVRGQTDGGSLTTPWHWLFSKNADSATSPSGIDMNCGTHDGDGGTYMVAIDADNGYIYRGRNGTWSNGATQSGIVNGTGTGNVATFTAGTFYRIGIVHRMVGVSSSSNDNFGQRPFAYTAPTGFKALCTTNLPTPTIQKPSKYMDVVTYTGTGAALTPTSSLGFSPDLVWIKGRSGATDHALYDTVRGAEKRLESNNTDAEVTSDGGVTSFDSGGFTLGTLAQVNTNTSTYVGWAWDEAPIAGMDIVSYTGNGANRTIAHNLGVAPKMVIVKARSGSGYSWNVWHSSLANTEFLLLESTAAKATDATKWNSTSPTSSSFSLGTSAGTNENTRDYIAYLFAEVEGFSKFGNYTGNGSADGPFVWCGFRPKWVMIKRTDSAGFNWRLQDTARGTYNQTENVLNPNLSDAESSGAGDYDILSNGFKIRVTGTGANASGGTYIFAAFAETAFRYARAR